MRRFEKMRERKNKCEREMDVKMYSMNPPERKRGSFFSVRVCVRMHVSDLMRWTVSGGACVTPSALVTVKMINSVKILQQLITAKQQIFNHFAYIHNS